MGRVCGGTAGITRDLPARGRAAGSGVHGPGAGVELRAFGPGNWGRILGAGGNQWGLR